MNQKQLVKVSVGDAELALDIRNIGGLMESFVWNISFTHEGEQVSLDIDDELAEQLIRVKGVINESKE
jgi:hypothetical protein